MTKNMNKKLFFLIYTVFVLLFSLELELTIQQLAYLSFAALVGFLFFNFQEEGQKIKLSKWLIVIPIIIILTVRIIPFIGTEAPLGYDTGIYRGQISLFGEAMHNSGTEIHPSGVYLVTDLLYSVGLSVDQILYGFFILITVLLGLGTYITVKRYFGANAAICAFFVYAVSATQFQAYWFVYFRQTVALFLMLIAFWLLKKKSWLVIPVAGFMGGMHQPTFLIFGLVLLAHFIFNKNKVYHLISGLSILAVGLSLYIHNPWTLFGLFPALNPLPMFTAPETVASGRFFDFSVYTQLAIFYLPFAILGFIYLIKKRRFDYLFFWFLFNFLIVYFGFFFHNRFIVHLDLIVIILAGVIISKILNKIPRDFYSKIAVLIFFFAAVCFLFNNVMSTKPSISQDELDEIKSLSVIMEEDAFVMSVVSHYSPWLYGYSERRVVAPGLLKYDTEWTKEEWNIFWRSDDLGVCEQLLDRYQKPLYIFIGDRDFEGIQQGLKLRFEQDPAIVRISERVYKYK